MEKVVYNLKRRHPPIIYFGLLFDLIIPINDENENRLLSVAGYHTNNNQVNINILLLEKVILLTLEVFGVSI